MQKLFQPVIEAFSQHRIAMILLTLLAVAGIILFALPMTVNIVNIGNLFGLACSFLLLVLTLWHTPFFALLGRIAANRIGKKILFILGAVIVLGVLYCLIMTCVMLHAAHKKPAEQPQTVIVLGCKVRGTAPSRMLSRRIRAAYALLEQNPDMKVIVSGGKGDNEDISEAQCMYNELTKLGISAERIIMEDQSTSTSENLRFSRICMQENGLTGSVYLATDGYHQLRAQILAKKEDLPECYPAAAYTSWYLVPTYWVREWFGLAHAFVFGN
ncbi:MAG: YdcF family protein [Oscillospiraceae bacterium]|nr:YdcF family protein [Oscillospiraceae bacterium]